MRWGSSASRMLEACRARLAVDARDRQLAQNPEAARFYSAASPSLFALDADTHIHVLSEALAVGRPALFTREMAWVRTSIEPRGFSVEDLSEFLTAVKELVQERAPEVSDEVGDAIDTALRLLQMPGSAPSFLCAQDPGTQVARDVVADLVHLDQGSAERRLLEAIDAGLTVRQAFEEVLFPALREIGRLWQLDRVSVATEHYATAALRDMAARLKPRGVVPHLGRSVVIACVETDLHEMGARLIADLLESEGWETVFLGAATPTDALLGLLSVRKPHALLIGATRVLDLRAAASLIASIREQAPLSHVPIVIGGPIFAYDPTLHEVLGADAHAVDAKEAHRVAWQLSTP